MLSSLLQNDNSFIWIGAKTEDKLISPRIISLSESWLSREENKVNKEDFPWCSKYKWMFSEKSIPWQLGKCNCTDYSMITSFPFRKNFSSHNSLIWNSNRENRCRIFLEKPSVLCGGVRSTKAVWGRLCVHVVTGACPGQYMSTMCVTIAWYVGTFFPI